MIWPRKKVAPERGGTGTRSSTGFILPASLPVAYRDLQAIARDPREPAVRRSLARAAGVFVHRMILLAETDTTDQVEAGGYLSNTIDTAARTSISLIESIDPLDTKPLTDGN